MGKIVESITPERKRRPRARLKEEEKQKIKELAQANPNLSHQQIGELVNVDRSTVTKVIAGFELDRAEVQQYTENRADILAALQRRLLVSITDDDIKRTSAAQRVTMAAILHDKERLERGQSTSNVLTIDVLAADILKGRKSDNDPSQS